MSYENLRKLRADGVQAINSNQNGIAHAMNRVRLRCGSALRCAKQHSLNANIDAELLSMVIDRWIDLLIAIGGLSGADSLSAAPGKAWIEIIRSCNGNLVGPAGVCIAKLVAATNLPAKSPPAIRRC